jgi:hypothetical protein
VSAWEVYCCLVLSLCECARQGSWQGVCSSAAWAVGTSAAQLLCGVVCGSAACCYAVPCLSRTHCLWTEAGAQGVYSSARVCAVCPAHSAGRPTSAAACCSSSPSVPCCQSCFRIEALVWGQQGACCPISPAVCGVLGRRKHVTPTRAGRYSMQVQLQLQWLLHLWTG